MDNDPNQNNDDNSSFSEQDPNRKSSEMSKSNVAIPFSDSPRVPSDGNYSQFELEQFFKTGQKFYDKALKLLDSGKIEKAQKNFTKALDLFEKADTLLMKANCHLRLGYIEEQEGNWTAAQQEYLNTLALREQRSVPSQLAEIDILLGKICIYSNQISAAHDYFQKAIDIMEKEHQSTEYLMALYWQGSLYLNQQEYVSAQFYLDLAFQQSRGQLERKYFQNILENLGYVYFMLSKYQESIQIYLQALQLAHYNRDFSSILENTRMLAENYSQINERDKSLGLIEDAYQIAESNPAIQTALESFKILESYARIAFNFGYLSKAEDLIEKVIEVAEKGELWPQLIMGLLLSAKIAFVQAEKNGTILNSKNQILPYLEEAQDLAQKYGLDALEVRVKVQKILLARKYEDKWEIEAQLKTLEKEVRAKPNKELLLGYYYDLKGLISHETGNTVDSLSCYMVAIRNFEKVNAFSELAECYYNASCTSCLIHMGEDTISYLRKAIALNNKYRKIAQTDEDFRSIRNDALFLSIVNTNEEDSADTDSNSNGND